MPAEVGLLTLGVGELIASFVEPSVGKGVVYSVRRFRMSGSVTAGLSKSTWRQPSSGETLQSNATVAINPIALYWVTGQVRYRHKSLVNNP